jgi:uncharacterized protein YkwD
VCAAAALACVGFGALAATAAAAPLTLQVVNARGVEQASLVTSSSGTRPTNGHGGLVLDVAPGEQITVSRGDGAPEGAGVAYTVPSAVPAGLVTVTLPALPDATAPAHDSAEAWMLARVNGERAALGRAPLAQSGSLNRAADAYARHLLTSGQFSHFALATPGVRAVDQGWPFPGGDGVGEVLALAASKESALRLWMGSPGHWTLLMRPEANVTGVAQAGNRWVMNPSICGPADAPERCEIGEGGVLARPTPPSGTPVGESSPSGVDDKRARLRVRLRRRGRRLIVVVRLVEGRGRVGVAVRQGRRRARVRRHQVGNLVRTKALLPRKGRWKVIVRFEGGPGWADRRLAPRRVLVR